MNTLVRIQGYVTDANVLEPYAKHSYDIKRYELHLSPSDCTHFYDLEHRVEELKREYEQQDRITRNATQITKLVLLSMTE